MVKPLSLCWKCDFQKCKLAEALIWGWGLKATCHTSFCQALFLLTEARASSVGSYNKSGPSLSSTQSSRGNSGRTLALPLIHPSSLQFVLTVLYLLQRVILLSFFAAEVTTTKCRALYCLPGWTGMVDCETADWLIIHDPSRLFTQ